MSQSLPFDDEPAIPRWRRVCLSVVTVLAVCGLGVAWNAMRYEGVPQILCVFAIVLYIAVAVLSGYPALYPREVEKNLKGFARNALWLSFVLLCFTTVVGAVGWLFSKYI